MIHRLTLQTSSCQSLVFVWSRKRLGTSDFVEQQAIIYQMI